MKFLTQRSELPEHAGRWVYMNIENEDGPHLLGQISGNMGKLEGGPALVNAANDGHYGTFAEDSAEHCSDQVAEIVRQGADSSLNASLEGSAVSRLFTPREFQGKWQLNLINPQFWLQTTLAPKSIILNQMKEGFDNLGDPSDLLGDSPLLSNKAVSALAGKKSMDALFKVMSSSGGGHLGDVSLTSIRILRAVMETANHEANNINEEQAADFFAKSGYDSKTGKRVDGTGEVWYKRWVRTVMGQRPLYRAKIKQIKNRRAAGHGELLSILQAVEQRKEQEIFTAKQTLDSVIIPAENEQDTPKLNAIRKTLHGVLNEPEKFIAQPASFATNGVSITELFGSKFSPMDVLEMLRGSRYEQVAGENPDYLDQAIKVNQLQMSHYNAMRTIDGVQTRVKAQEKFSGTGLEQLEAYVNKRYEASEEPIDLRNPQALVDEIIQAVGSATPKLVKDLQMIMGSDQDVYLGATEVFWHLADFLGKNTAVFDRLPPQLQQRFAQFFLKKRDALEKAAISGSLDEKGTFLWRMRALNQGSVVLKSFDELRLALPKMTEALRSRNSGDAQEALRSIKTVIDNYQIFQEVLGDSVMDDLPELERGILSNIKQFEPTLEGLKNTHESLVANRNEFENIIDQDKDWVLARQQEYDRKNELFESFPKEGKTGLEGIKVMPYGGGGDGDGDGGGIGLETTYTSLQRDLDSLRSFLQVGEDGGAIGKMKKLDNYTFDAIPGNIGDSIGNISDVTQKLIARRFKELGIKEGESLDFLVDDQVKPTFDVLARLELGEIATRDVLKTARTLLQNDGAQQYQRLSGVKYNELSQIVYVPAKHQSELTVAGLMNPEVAQNALYVNKNADGSFLYHTKTQIFRFTPPRLGDNTDERNLEIWYKSPHEKGLGPFTVPGTQPDMLGMMLTVNPENQAAANNPYYGAIEKKVQSIHQSVDYKQAA